MSSPYFDYKNKVKYDYVFRATMPITYEGDEEHNGKYTEEEIWDVSENIQEGIENLNSDEDYVKESFEEIALGRVYIGCNQVSDEIELYIGISLSENENPEDIKEEDLIEDIKEYMYCLDSNTEFKNSVRGNFITFKGNGRDTVKVEVKKSPKTESLNIEFDKKLVNEGKIIFTDYRRQGNKIVILNDDGIVQVCNESKRRL